MSKFRLPYSKKDSPLFDGHTIFSQLDNGSFGQFQKAVHNVSTLLPQGNFQLPKIVVVGGKSAGKSSLLENITKCCVFPRNRNLCTKQPIKLQLNHVESPDAVCMQVLYKDIVATVHSGQQISGLIDNIMTPLDAVSDDEVIIKISQVSP